MSIHFSQIYLDPYIAFKYWALFSHVPNGLINKQKNCLLPQLLGLCKKAHISSTWVHFLLEQLKMKTEQVVLIRTGIYVPNVFSNNNLFYQPLCV